LNIFGVININIGEALDIKPIQRKKVNFVDDNNTSATASVEDFMQLLKKKPQTIKEILAEVLNKQNQILALLSRIESE